MKKPYCGLFDALRKDVLGDQPSGTMPDKSRNIINIENKLDYIFMFFIFFDYYAHMSVHWCNFVSFSFIKQIKIKWN